MSSDFILAIYTVRVKKCPKVTVVTQYFCNINSRYYIAYYCVGDRMVRTKKTGQCFSCPDDCKELSKKTRQLKPKQDQAIADPIADPIADL